MSEIIQANYSWSKTSGETDLGRNVWTEDNSPHIKLTQRQLAPDSETNSLHVVILHYVLKYAGKIYKRTGHSRYVDFAYLDTTTYVEVIFHSQHFFSIFLCISTPSMSKMVNTKQRVSRGDFFMP